MQMQQPVGVEADDSARPNSGLTAGSVAAADAVDHIARTE